MNIEPEIIQSIRNQTCNVFDDLIQIRHDLHQHPELSGQEAWTANYLAKALNRLGLNLRTGIGGYGLVADLITNPSHATIALRVDMDALPIHETTNAAYRSKVPGLMHACGHDVHSAIGVGTAAVLTAMANKLNGNIRFIFQPEEEAITGAQRMIRDGVLRHPQPEAILGLHVAPIPVGQIAWSDSLFLAGFDHLLGILTPQVGTSMPSQYLDAIAQHCCQVILGFNQWHLPNTWEDMQTFWKTMQAGPKNLQNFIIYDASLNNEDPIAWHGQFGVGIKAANQHLRRAAVGRIKASLKTICGATRTNYRLVPMGAMLDMRNDPHLVRSTLSDLSYAIGPQNTIQLKAAFPFNCEDFAYYTKIIPGAMYWLGAADPSRGKYAMLHTPNFDVDENSLKTGTIAMATLLISTLLK
jgi:amidohydrolase